MKNSLLVKFRDLMKYEKLGVQIDPSYTNQIKNDIKIRFGTYEKAAKKAGFSHRVIYEMQKRCIRVYNWNKLIILLELQIDDFEKHIIKIADKRTYNIRFPYEVSPLLIRLVSHIIGDGGYYGNNARWIQKDVQPIINVQKQNPPPLAEGFVKLVSRALGE